MITVPYIDDNWGFLAKCLMAQAGVKACDCDCPCSCLKLELIQFDIFAVQIRANGQEFRIRGLSC